MRRKRSSQIRLVSRTGSEPSPSLRQVLESAYDDGSLSFSDCLDVLFELLSSKSSTTELGSTCDGKQPDCQLGGSIKLRCLSHSRT